MFTVIETQVFIRYAADVWQEDERVRFIHWIANNPMAGDVIVGSGGLRTMGADRHGKTWWCKGNYLHAERSG